MSKITIANRKFLEEQVKLALRDRSLQEEESFLPRPAPLDSIMPYPESALGKSLMSVLKSMYRDVEHRFFKSNITQAIAQRDDNLKNIEEIKMFLSTFQDSKFFGEKPGHFFADHKTKSLHNGWWTDPQTYFATDVVRLIQAFKSNFKTEIKNLKNNENRLGVYKKYAEVFPLPGFEYSDEIVKDSARKNVGLDVMICRSLKIVQFYEEKNIIEIKKNEEAKDILIKTRDAFEKSIRNDKDKQKDWNLFTFAMVFDPGGEIDIKFFDDAYEEYEPTEKVDGPSSFAGMVVEFNLILKVLRSLPRVEMGGWPTFLLATGGLAYDLANWWMDDGLWFSKKREINNHLDSITKELKNMIKNHRGVEWYSTPEENKRVKKHIEIIFTIYHKLFVKAARESIYSIVGSSPGAKNEVSALVKVVFEISKHFYTLKNEFEGTISSKYVNGLMKTVDNLRADNLISIEALTQRINNLSLVDEEKQMKKYNNKDVRLLVSEMINEKDKTKETDPKEKEKKNKEQRDKNARNQIDQAKKNSNYNPERVEKDIEAFLKIEPGLTLKLADYVAIINKLNITNLNDLEKFIQLKPVKIPKIETSALAYQAGWSEFWQQNFFRFRQQQFDNGLTESTIQWFLSSAFASKGGLFREYRSRTGLLKAEQQPAELIAMVGPYNGTENSCFLFFSRHYEFTKSLISYGQQSGQSKIERLRESKISKEGSIDKYVNGTRLKTLTEEFKKTKKYEDKDTRDGLEQAQLRGYYRVRELLYVEIRIYNFLKKSMEGIYEIDDLLTDKLKTIADQLSNLDASRQASTVVEISREFLGNSSLKIANFEGIAILEKELEKLGIKL